MSVEENTTAAVYTATATDADGDAITYTLSGADAALFDIDPTTGEVTFKTAPDFETPGDANTDNIYDIIVTASDGTNTTDQAVAITVTNLDDQIFGTSGNDTLDGTSGADEIYGRAGGDTIRGQAGNDRIFGEDGNDRLDGGAGDDYVDGGSGNDTLTLRTGAPWAEIPERYGPATTCYNRFVRWRKLGVWDRVFNAITAAYDGDIQMIDSSSIRVHQHGANAKKGGPKPPRETPLTPDAWGARAAD